MLVKVSDCSASIRRNIVLVYSKLNMYFYFSCCLGLVMKKITVSKVAQGMVASTLQKLKEPRPEEPQQILYTNADILRISEQYSATS